MNIFMSFRIAFRALARNKMRSALTMLGIIIGVAAVIAMVSIGQGAQASVQEQIASVGTNLLFVGAGSQNVGGVRSGTGATNSNTLTVDSRRSGSGWSRLESSSPKPTCELHRECWLSARRLPTVFFREWIPLARLSVCASCHSAWSE